MLELPAGIEVLQKPSGLRFRGTARALLLWSDRLRTLRDSPVGTRVPVADWELVVAAVPPAERPRRAIHLPPDAWNIAASKFAEVATGWESSPFDFRDCGYLSPPPDPDIGVELVGEPERE